MSKRRAGPGRPRLPETDKKSERCTFRLCSRGMSMLARLSFLLGEKDSEVIRASLEVLLEREEARVKAA